MKLTDEDILRSCSMLGRIAGDSGRQLLSCAARRRYAKGQVIFAEGDDPPGLFIVGTGLVRVYKLAPNGKEHVLHLAGPGSTFLEVAVLGELRCPASAEAVEPSDCLMLATAPLRRLLAEDHQLCLQILAGMSQWVRRLVGLLEDIVLRDALGRVARYLLEAPQQTDDVVHLLSLKKHLASHLNLTSETLSRTLRRLTDLRMIDSTDAQEIRITNRRGLRHAAEGMLPEL